MRTLRQVPALDPDLRRLHRQIDATQTDASRAQSDATTAQAAAAAAQSTADAAAPKGGITASSLTIATNRIAGRVSAATGAVEEIDIGALAAAVTTDEATVSILCKDSDGNVRKLTVAALRTLFGL